MSLMIYAYCHVCGRNVYYEYLENGKMKCSFCGYVRGNAKGIGAILR